MTIWQKIKHFFFGTWDFVYGPEPKQKVEEPVIEPPKRTNPFEGLTPEQMEQFVKSLAAYGKVQRERAKVDAERFRTKQAQRRFRQQLRYRDDDDILDTIATSLIAGAGVGLIVDALTDDSSSTKPFSGNGGEFGGGGASGDWDD